MKKSDVRQERSFQKAYQVACFSFTYATDKHCVITKAKAEFLLTLIGRNFNAMFLSLESEFWIIRWVTVAEMEKDII